MLQEDVDEEETECILANLIEKAMVRGVISRRGRHIVLSIKNPVPALRA